MEYVIFGASYMGKLALAHLEKTGCTVTAFCDNSAEKQGSHYMGIPVVAPDSLESCKKEIIIASAYHVSIASQLIGMGIKRFSVYYLKNYSEPSVLRVDYQEIERFTEKPNKIAFLVENYSGSNTAALYRYCVSRSDNRFECAVINDGNRSPDYYYNLLTSKIIIRSYSGGAIDGKINIQLWHGVPLKGLGYMSASGDYSREAQHREWEKFDYIISYSRLYSTLMGACFGLKRDKFKILGMPRNDLLFSSDGRGMLESIYGIKHYEKTVIYMPTYRRSHYGENHGESDGYFFSAPGFDAEAFNRFLYANNIKMLVKLHQLSILTLPAGLKGKSNIIIADNLYFDKNAIEFYEILNGFDLLITDYSSVYFDFLLLERPIIFTPLDIPRYSELQGFLLEPYEIFAPGPKALTAEALKREILMCLSNNDYYKTERSLVKAMAHKYTDANSCERLYSALLEIAEETA